MADGYEGVYRAAVGKEAPVAARPHGLGSRSRGVTVVAGHD
jgi:hypothetical protein